MQDDPQYAKLLKKSFIMSKYHERNPRAQIPQIKKQPTIAHQVTSTAVLSTLIHMFAFPADTVKVRKQAKNKLLDVARFETNKVVTLTPYLGFFKGYISILIGNLCFLTLGKENFFLGVAAEGVLKTWIDISKISTQMGNNQMKMDVAKKIFPSATLFSIARDLTSRGSYILVVDALIKQFSSWLAKDRNRRYHIYFGSAIVATLLSHPFDVAFTKLASQRSLRYNGIFGVLKTIVKDEGVGKLYSGMDYRLLYNLVSVIVMGNSYEPLMELTLDAF